MLQSRVTLGKYLIYCILVSLLVIILTFTFMGYMNFSMSFWVITGITAGINILMYLIYLHPLIGIILAIIASAYSAGCYFLYRSIFINIVQDIWFFMAGTIKWFIDYMYDAVKLNFQYMNTVVVLFIVLVTMALFFLIVMRRYAVFTLIAGVACISPSWFLGYDDALGYIQEYVFVCFILYGFVNYHYKEIGWKLKQDKYSKRTVIGWMLSTLIAMAVVFLITGFLPNNIKAVDFKWLNDNAVSRFVNLNFRNSSSVSKSELSDKFSISSVGFQEVPSRLGGAVRLSNRLMLKVKAEGDAETPLYLRGAVKDFYSGSMWTKTESVQSSIKDSVEIGSLLANDSMVKKNRNISITVYPEAISTTTLFNIWKPYEALTGTDLYNYNEDGELSLQSSSYKIKEYKVISHMPVVYSDELRGVQKFVNKGEAFQKYLEVPSGMPDRVKSLALSITGKYKNDYDKVVAIQEYLRNTFPYTLDTSPVPDGRDFIDFFMFEEKKGYCTYYASAMAIMSRIAGIPSRYVEGFVLNDKDKDVNGVYNVTSASAHAWVEIYFDGYGWSRFEPTSAYKATDYEKSASEVDKSAGNSEENELPSNISGTSDRKNMNNDTPDTSGVNLSKTLPFELYIIAALIIMVLLRILIKIYIESTRVKKADRLRNKEAAAEYFSMLEKKLKSGGLERASGETPVEFGERIYKDMTNYGIDMKDVASTFSRIRFGNNKADTASRNKFKYAIKMTDRLIRDRRGLIQYVVMKYIF